MKIETAQNVVVTPGDLYASAASAEHNGRHELAAQIERIGDALAAGDLPYRVHAYVWQCTEPGCIHTGLSATPRRAAQQYAEHFTTAHQA